MMKDKKKRNLTKTNTQKKAMIIALEKSLGVVSIAVKKVKISRFTHYEWLKTDKTYKKAVEDVANISLDFVESKLFELIKGVKLPETKFFCYEGRIISQEIDKNYPPDNTSVIFYLKTKGKERGYVERQEVTGKDGKDIKAPIIYLPSNGRD